MRQLREFTEVDWYGLAGCEPGPNGEEPQITYDADAVIIADNRGVAVQIGEDTEYQLSTNGLALSILIAGALPAPITPAALLGLGFECINGGEEA